MAEWMLLGCGVYNPPRRYIGRDGNPIIGRYSDSKPKMHIVAGVTPNEYTVQTLCGRSLKYLMTRLRNVDHVPAKDVCKRCSTIELERANA